MGPFLFSLYINLLKPEWSLHCTQNMFCTSTPTLYSFVLYLLRTFYVCHVYPFMRIQKKNLKRQTFFPQVARYPGVYEKAIVLGSECAAIGWEKDTEGTQGRNTSGLISCFLFWISSISVIQHFLYCKFTSTL